MPPSLAPGSQYRLVFVTDGTRDATSSNIADYDAFVTAEASTEFALTSIGWRAIASTATVSANQHTQTDYPDRPGVPIFRLDGVLVAWDYQDLWDEILQAALNVDQHGDPVGNSFVWTGTLPSGGAHPLSLGQPSAMRGWTNYPENWIAGPFSSVSTTSLRLYAMSDVLTVPEASLGALCTFFFGSLLLVRRLSLR